MTTTQRFVPIKRLREVIGRCLSRHNLQSITLPDDAQPLSHVPIDDDLISNLVVWGQSKQQKRFWTLHLKDKSLPIIATPVIDDDATPFDYLTQYCGVATNTPDVSHVDNLGCYPGMIAPGRNEIHNTNTLSIIRGDNDNLVVIDRASNHLVEVPMYACKVYTINQDVQTTNFLRAYRAVESIIGKPSNVTTLVSTRLIAPLVDGIQPTAISITTIKAIPTYPPSHTITAYHNSTPFQIMHYAVPLDDVPELSPSEMVMLRYNLGGSIVDIHGKGCQVIEPKHPWYSYHLLDNRHRVESPPGVVMRHVCCRCSSRRGVYDNNHRFHLWIHNPLTHHQDT